MGTYYGTRALSSTFTWADFYEMSLWIYNPTAEGWDPDAAFRFGFRTAQGELVYYEKSIADLDAAVWTQISLYKDDFTTDPTITEDSVFTEQYVQTREFYSGDLIYIDGWDISAQRISKTITVDEKGHLKVSVNLPTGAATETTLAAIQTAVELIDNMISGNEAQVDVVTNVHPAGLPTIGHGANTDINTSAEPLDPTSITCKFVIVTAHPDNTARLWVGGSGIPVEQGTPLDALDVAVLPTDNVNKIYVIAEAINQKATYTYLN